MRACRNTHACMSWFFFSYKKRTRERKRETERPQFLLPSAPHSSLLLRRSRQPTRRNIAAAATEIQSLLIGHCISVKVLFSVGRRHDFKEVRDLKAFSLLVRPTTTYTHTYNNVDTSCSLVSNSLYVRKPRFPSAFNSVHAFVRTNRNRSFSVLKKEEGEGNDNDGIATTIRFALVITTNIVDRYFSSHIWEKKRRKWWYKKLSTSVHRGKRKREKGKGEKIYIYIYQGSRDYKNGVENICIHFDVSCNNILIIVILYIFSRTIKAYVDTYRHWRFNIECFQ